MLTWYSNLSSLFLFLLCLVGSAAWYILSAARSWYRLRHVPTSSIFAGFSYLWLARTTYSGRQHWVYRNLHQKHGPLVRIGPNEVLTDDAEIIKEISSSSNMFHRGEWYLAGRFNPYHDNLFTILQPEAHKKAKSRSMPAYLGRETPGLEIGINDQVKQLLDVLQERYLTTSPGQTEKLLNLGSISCYFTMDVITRLAFGRETGYLKYEKDHYGFLESVRRLWPRMSTSADVPWIRNIVFSSYVLRLFGPKATDKDGFGALMGVAERYVSNRFNSGEGKEGNMLESLIKRGFNRQECEVESLFLLLSGTESTACAIRSILVHAITSPTVYSKLKDEIHLACSKGDVPYPISLAKAKKLPYLQAVIYEGLRMRPPLLGLFPKIVPKSGATFHGLSIPAGVSVCTNMSSLLRSTSLFGMDADAFRPERFTVANKLERDRMERNVELAFGHGQWMCAGKTIAFMELNKVIFELLRAFDIQLADPLTPRDIQSYGVFIEQNLLVRISKDSRVALT